MAAQDQILFTRNYQAKTVKIGADTKFWFCNKFEEAVDHLVYRCPIMTPNEHLQRHNGGLNIFTGKHFSTQMHHNAENWNEHKPQKVAQTESAKVLWDFFIHTDGTIKVNRPDITMKDLEEKSCKLLDFTFLMDVNISAKGFESLSKYKDLDIEVDRVWQLITSLISLIVVGALRLVKKGTAKHLEKIPGKQNLAEIQNVVFPSTEHILRNAISI